MMQEKRTDYSPFDAEFKKGSELDKQIYPEGEPTWGCKQGVLDVEDVKMFIERLNEYAEAWEWEGSEIINEMAGEKLKCDALTVKGGKDEGD